MSHLKSIEVSGLKSLVDTGKVILKPINVLVGTNSSGKSSFLRLFPLLRQSVQRRTRGPILWNGEYTDFESFDNSLSSSLTGPSQDKAIGLSFEYDINSNSPFSHQQLKDVLLKTRINIKAAKSKFTSYTNTYSITLDEHELTMIFNENGKLLDIVSPLISWDISKTDLEYQQAETDSLLPFFNASGSFMWSNENNSREISNILFSNIKSQVAKLSGSKSDDRITRHSRSLVYTRGTITEKKEKYKSLKITKKWERECQSEHRISFLAALSDLLFIVNHSEVIYRSLSKIFTGVRYIAPLRTSTERYYRFQDLSIDEIDHKGTNLAMFLTAISKRWREQLNIWTMDNFNFLIKEKYAGSNISIELSYGNENSFDNITDMGFGFSQILPIIVNLWSVSSGYENSKKRNFEKQNSIIFAIEQPELHLHPKMQASLAVIFSKAIYLAKNNGISLSLIIETHSPALISKFGDLIATEELTPEKVNVLLFEQDRALRKTDISYANFDEEGILENWPVDFFYS